MAQVDFFRFIQQVETKRIEIKKAQHPSVWQHPDQSCKDVTNSALSKGRWWVISSDLQFARKEKLILTYVPQSLAQWS